MNNREAQSRDFPMLKCTFDKFIKFSIEWRLFRSHAVGDGGEEKVDGTFCEGNVQVFKQIRSPKGSIYHYLGPRQTCSLCSGPPCLRASSNKTYCDSKIHQLTPWRFGGIRVEETVSLKCQGAQRLPLDQVSGRVSTLNHSFPRGLMLARSWCLFCLGTTGAQT